MLTRFAKLLGQPCLYLFLGWVAFLHLVLVLVLIGFIQSFGLCQCTRWLS